MVLTSSTLSDAMSEARALGKDLGVVTRDLTDMELTRFGRSFERQFVLALPTREMVDIHMRHIKEAMLGAMIAKEQMDAEIDDEIPASNKIGGPISIRACFLGVGDDWEDIRGIYGGVQNSWSTGTAQHWIHSGTTLMAGLAGNRIRIGENAVHVIYGVTSRHASPKIESIQFNVDGKLKPIMILGWAQKNAVGHNLRIKEFDNAFILKRDTEFSADVFIPANFGAPVPFVEDFPELYGVSFVKEPALRVLDPGAVVWVGARFEVVHAT